jgi:uncharacterized protein (TIGR02453 family)
MAFKGWRVEALEFFEGLEADNSKTYWLAHKDEYVELVRAPMEALIAELEPDGGKIFRPYRDVRFSKDKSPYKTNIAAIVADCYVHLDKNGLAAGAGMWEMARDQLERYREAVDDDTTGGALTGLVDEASAAGLGVMAHGELKTAPRGYPKDHPRVELLRYKGLALWREWPAGAWLGTKRAKDRIVGFRDDASPVQAWLDANVGPSTLPEPTR